MQPYVLVRLKRPEGYEDVHPELLLEDVGIHAVFEPELVQEDSKANVGSSDLTAESRAEDAALRMGVRQMTMALRKREWADLLTTDTDLADLEAEVGKLIWHKPRKLTQDEIGALWRDLRARGHADDNWNDFWNVVTCTERAIVAKGRTQPSSDSPASGGTSPHGLDLTPNELAFVVNELHSQGHGHGSSHDDFEPECPTCTAADKLAARAALKEPT